jgi:hypothetical protein
VLDRDVVEENLKLLMPCWSELRRPSAPNSYLQLGMDSELAAELADLDEVQVRRAADAAAPLFRLAQPDAVIISALTAQDAGNITANNELDIVVRKQNELFLLNRWVSARQSAAAAQCLFGLSSEVMSCFRSTTIGDVTRAAGRGIRFAQIAARPRYFFHAGRHITLSTSTRTALAVCCSTRAKG